MDYKKKYDEALERAKQKINAGPLTEDDLSYIFPELRESEDERIRKAIQIALSLDSAKGYLRTWGISYEQADSWLEKQKENPKNADSIPEDCTSLAKCEDRDSKYGVFPEDVIVVARACEKLEAHGYPELAHALKNVNLYTKEQKPVEWSEEDEKLRKLLIAILEVNYPDGFFKANELGDVNMRGVHTEELVSWLKDLCTRFNFQPKQEWSEYDKVIINNIVLWLSGSFISESARNECLKWFNEHRRDFLAQPHWKPSEEQINALDEVYKTHGANSSCRRIIFDLLNRLKNL